MCIANSNTLAGYARRLAHGRRFSDLDQKSNCYGTPTYKPDREWDHVAENMMINFSESGHRAFRGSSAFERGSLRSKGCGKLSFHFCGHTDTAEVVLRTVTSVNQLSVYGAVADMCDELDLRISDCSKSSGRPVAEDKSEIMVVPTDLSTTTKPVQTNEPVQGDLPREYERKFANLPDDIKLIRLFSNAGFMKSVAK